MKDEEHGGWFVPRLGKYVPAPLHSGDPTFDLNCRCRVTARVKYLQSMREAEPKGIPYSDWEKEYDARRADALDKYDAMVFRTRGDDIVINRSKVENYLLLNPGKAIGFKKYLGLTQKDTDYLIDQIRTHVKDAAIERMSIDSFGRRYNTIMDIEGINGKKYKCRFGWIFDRVSDAEVFRGLPRLITGWCYGSNEHI